MQYIFIKHPQHCSLVAFPRADILFLLVLLQEIYYLYTINNYCLILNDSQSITLFLFTVLLPRTLYDVGVNIVLLNHYCLVPT